MKSLFDMLKKLWWGPTPKNNPRAAYLHPQIEPGRIELTYAKELGVFLGTEDVRTAKEQITANYAKLARSAQRSKLWRSSSAFEIVHIIEDNGCARLIYNGATLLKEVSRARLSKNELLIFFDPRWIVVMQNDKTYQVLDFGALRTDYYLSCTLEHHTDANSN